MANKKIQLMNSGGTDNLYPRVEIFIDTNNILADENWSGGKDTVHGFTWTATEDAVVYTAGYEIRPARWTLNSVYIYNNDTSGGSGRGVGGGYFVKKGDTFHYESHVRCIVRAFGLKA